MNKRILLIALESSVLSLNAFVVQSLSLVRLFVTTMDCSRPGFPILHYLPEFAQTHVHCVSDDTQPSHPLSPSFLHMPSIFPSIRICFNELAFPVGWPNYWSFSFSMSPSNEYLELISFRINWFELLGIQGTLNSLTQHYSSKTSVLQHSAFFMVQLSYLHMTAGKTIALTILNSVIKVMSLLFKIVPRFVIAFLPRSKCLLISSLQSQSAVILEPKRIKSVTVYIVSPSICYEVMGPDAMIFVF